MNPTESSSPINPETKKTKDLEHRLENLGIKLEELKGRVLDIGAGHGEFGDKLMEINPDVEVVSADSLPSSSDEQKGIVKADSHDLLFEDEEFDFVVSNYSIPIVFVSEPIEPENLMEQSLYDSFDEIIRVLKPGGKSRLAPIIIRNYEKRYQDLEVSIRKVVEDLNEAGLVVAELQFIKDSDTPTPSKWWRIAIHKLE